MGVDPRGPGVARTRERPDHTLTVQGGAQPLVVHMTLDDIGDRRVEQHLERFRVVGEQRFELGTIGCVTEPQVAARAAAQPVVDACEKGVVGEETVDVAPVISATERAVFSSSCHCTSVVPSAKGVHCVGSTGKVRKPRLGRSSSPITSGCNRPTRYAHGLIKQYALLLGSVHL